MFEATAVGALYARIRAIAASSACGCWLRQWSTAETRSHDGLLLSDLPFLRLQGLPASRAHVFISVEPGRLVAPLLRLPALLQHIKQVLEPLAVDHAGLTHLPGPMV